MRVLITGAHGQVGQALMRSVPDKIETVALPLDITEQGQVAQRLVEVAPDAIINTAAYTAVDRAENDRQRAYAVNRDGVAWLADAAERLAIPMLHLSSDYVFHGDSCVPYREIDACAPLNVYGASKLAGEQILAERCSRWLVLRTSRVFGVHGSNFVKTMLAFAGERDELAVVADQWGCPTSAISIASTLWRLVELYHRQGALSWGCYHFSGASMCSWYEFAELIFLQAHELGLIMRVPKLRALAASDYPTAALRPRWSVLDCSRLRAEFGIPQPDWRLDLYQVLREIRQSMPG